MTQLLFVGFIFRNYLCGYSTPRSKPRSNFHPTGFACLSQIIQYIVCQSLIKDAFIAVALHIEFQALQLDAGFLRTVFDDDFAKVGLACTRTNARKLGTSYGYTIVPFRARIIKQFYFRAFAHYCFDRFYKLSYDSIIKMLCQDKKNLLGMSRPSQVQNLALRCKLRYIDYSTVNFLKGSRR